MKGLWAVFRVCLCLILLTADLALSGAPVVRGASAWYVSRAGNDSSDCATAATPCASLAAAIARAASGDTLYVTAETYTHASGTEVVALDRSLVLEGGWDVSFGAQSGYTTLDGEYVFRGVRVNADVTTTLRRFVLTRGMPSGPFVSMGGGILNAGSLTLDQSEVRDSQYAGIYSYGTLDVRSSSVIGNIIFGGIRVEGGSVRIANSTIALNAGGGCGGLCVARATDVQLSNVTITGNRALYGGVTGGIQVYTGSAVHLRNSIVAGNSPEECLGSVVLEGYNLVGRSSTCTGLQTTATDRLDVQAQLGILQGQPMHAQPRFGSLAIDAGDPAGCRDSFGQLLDTDARGASRVGLCDAGALEAGLELVKTAGGVTMPGSLQHFRVQLRNLQGNALLSAVVMTDVLPSGLTLVPGSLAATRGDAQVLGNGVAWHGDVSGTETTTITFDAFLDVGVPETAWITNVATATWNGMTASDQWVLPASPHQFLPALGRNSCNDFADDFGNPASGWLVKENDIDRLGYLSGEYQMFIKQPYYIGVEVPTCPRANYEVESRMRWVGAPGSYYGLAFGRAGDWSQYYLFAVSAEASRFAIFRLDGASTTLVNWTANAAILGGEGQNTLRVMRNGTTITALVNNVAVATLSDSAFGGLTGVGLIAAAHTGQFGVDARFDDVSVRLLPGDGLASLSGSATLADAGADIRDIPGGALAGPGARRAP